MTGSLRSLLRILRATAPTRSGHASYLFQQLIGRRRNKRPGPTDRLHLLAAAEWLEHAQDAIGDGGVSGRYRLDTGWTSAYPETTGYIIPTFLRLARELDLPRFRDRAARCVDFLLKLQMPDGSFPALEMAVNLTEPSPFNSAQIIHGLIAWHSETGEDRAMEAAQKAADWILSVQDDDGAFRRHFYLGVATTYSAHLSCWVAELGQHTKAPGYLRSAERHLDWVLSHLDKGTGWFNLCGFSPEEHRKETAFTHTIAYTIWGVLVNSEILGRPDGVEAAKRAAMAVVERLELSHGLPGILDSGWGGGTSELLSLA